MKEVPWEIPRFGASVDDVLLAGGDHLICDFDKQSCHPLGSVVVERHAVYHPDTVHQGRNMFHHLQLSSCEKNLTV